MAPHSSTLAWKIPWTVEPGMLQSMESLSRTGLSDFTFTFHFHALDKEMATHSSVPAWRIPGMRSLAGRTESDTTEVTQQQQQQLPKGFLGSSAGKESACNAGDAGSIPGSGRSPGEEIGYPHQCSWASLVAQLVKNLPAMWVDLGSIPGLGRSLEEGKGYPFQYSGLENFLK